ncbi:MAG: helix-turn-helix domain-containing protein, partial [Muribaculaceae bacterium]|nr:helix-turn-helix domain-containing protein [Muribaculaceae bacterium]
PNTKSSESQCAMIKDWLESGKAIDGMIALNLFGCFRLPSRIHDLKERGMKITDRWKTTESGKRVKEYLLAI